MAKKRLKRLYNSTLGIPLWILSGLAIFILFSAIYDFVVLDRSQMRYILLFVSMGLLLILAGLHFVSVKAISRQARKQLGG